MNLIFKIGVRYLARSSIYRIGQSGVESQAPKFGGKNIKKPQIQAEKGL